MGPVLSNSVDELAKLLERVLDLDMEPRLNFGGELTIIAAILEQPVIEKIRTPLEPYARAPPRAPARDQALQAARAQIKHRRVERPCSRDRGDRPCPRLPSRPGAIRGSAVHLGATPMTGSSGERRGRSAACGQLPATSSRAANRIRGHERGNAVGQDDRVGVGGRSGCLGARVAAARGRFAVKGRRHAQLSAASPRGTAGPAPSRGARYGR